jgi:hypothetical protein
MVKPKWKVLQFINQAEEDSFGSQWIFYGSNNLTCP